MLINKPTPHLPKLTTYLHPQLLPWHLPKTDGVLSECPEMEHCRAVVLAGLNKNSHTLSCGWGGSSPESTRLAGSLIWNPPGLTAAGDRADLSLLDAALCSAGID